MTRLKTILNKYKETRMARPKFRMQENYADYTDEQIAGMIKKLTESRDVTPTPITSDMVNHPPHRS